MLLAEPPKKIKIDPDVKRYISGVLDGSIVTGRLVKLAVQRYLEDIETCGRRGLYFDSEAAQFAIDFFPILKHSKGKFAGQPFVLEPWEKFIIWNIFGFKKRTRYG